MPSGEGFIQLVPLSHKSRRFTLSTGLKMFLVAPTKGLSKSLWGVTWCKVAEQLGMPLTSIPHGGPILQAPLENGSMSGFPIKGCAFAMWIREILGASPDKLGHGLTNHSAKCTTLSWMSKLNCSELSRCILGHHVPKCSTAVLTYSRDEQSGPLRELVSAYADIRSGRFVPDATRSGMLCSPDPPVPVDAEADKWYEPARDRLSPQDIEGLLQEAQDAALGERPVAPQSPALESQEPESFSVVGQSEDAPPEGSEMSSSSSSSSSSNSSDSEGVDNALEECAEDSPELVTSEPLCNTYQHVRTNTLHLLPKGSSQGRFVCGRPLQSADHQPFTARVMVESWWCRQCRSGKPIRDSGALNTALDSALKRVRTA